MNKKKINWGYFGSLILSVVLALAVGAAIMAATGYDPLNAYHELFRGATGCDNLGQVFTGLFTKRRSQHGGVRHGAVPHGPGLRRGRPGRASST